MNQDRCTVSFDSGYFHNLDCYVDFQYELGAYGISEVKIVGFGYLNELEEECDLFHMTNIDCHEFNEVLEAAITEYTDSEEFLKEGVL